MIPTAVKSTVKPLTRPMFRDPNTMTYEQLHDPHYRLKELMKQNGTLSTTCSKCHHCR